MLHNTERSDTPNKYRLACSDKRSSQAVNRSKLPILNIWFIAKFSVCGTLYGQCGQNLNCQNLNFLQRKSRHRTHGQTDNGRGTTLNVPSVVGRQHNNSRPILTSVYIIWLRSAFRLDQWSRISCAVNSDSPRRLRDRPCVRDHAMYCYVCLSACLHRTVCLPLTQDWKSPESPKFTERLPIRAVLASWLLLRPLDIHVGGLIFYQGFFFLSFFRRLISELTKRNSTVSGHMVGSKCNLKTRVQYMGYSLTLQIGGPKTTFWTTSQLNGNFNGLYYRN